MAVKEYTVQELSSAFGLHPETIRRWIRAGKVKAEKRSKKEGYIVYFDDNEVSLGLRKYNWFALHAFEYQANKEMLEAIEAKIAELESQRDAIKKHLKKLSSESYFD